MIRTTPGDPQGVDIVFLDDHGADLSQAAQRKLERVFSRQEFRRAFPGEIAELTFPARVVETYVHELLRCVDMTGVREAGLKVVLDCAGGTASLVLPALLGRLGVDVLTVNDRLDETSPTETLAERMRDLERLGELCRPRARRSACGSTRSASGSRSSTRRASWSATTARCSSCSTWSPPSAAAAGWRCRSPRPGWPSRSAASTACEVDWTLHLAGRLTKAAAAEDVIFAGDGRGGFVIPEFHPASTASPRSSGCSAWSPVPS